MKKFILIIVVLFSCHLTFAGSDYHWLKMNFPDIEVTMTANYESDIYAVSVENELYHFNIYTDNKDTWEVVETGIEAIINCVSPRFLGTDKGLYHINHYDLTFDKIDEFENMNISGIFYRPLISHILFIETDMGLFSQTFEGTIKKCPRPDGEKKIKDIVEGSSSRVLGLTTSGELFYSSDTCQTWTKAVDNPEGHKFTAIEEHYYYIDWFLVGTDKSLFLLRNDTLTEIMDYDGGSVSCINHNFFWVSGGKTDKKKNRTQFKEFENYSFAVGTSMNGVYQVDYNRAIKTNDSLRDLSISAICNSYSWRYIFVATKNGSIYRNSPHFASVEELDLAPYDLKISPNPAKSRPSISFHNPEYAEIEIAVYDLFGRKFADVHSGSLAEGDYNFSADLSVLASGSYFLRFGVGGRVGSLNLIVE